MMDTGPWPSKDGKDVRLVSRNKKAFNHPHLEGKDLRKEPLSARRKLDVFVERYSRASPRNSTQPIGGKKPSTKKITEVATMPYFDSKVTEIKETLEGVYVVIAEPNVASGLNRGFLLRLHQSARIGSSFTYLPHRRSESATQ